MNLLPVQCTTSERATISIFVLSGSPLQASISFEGPVAKLGSDRDMQLFYGNIVEFEGSPRTKFTSDDFLNEKHVVDFEHIEYEPLDEEQYGNYGGGDEDSKHSEVMKTYERAKRRSEIVKRKREAIKATDDPVLVTNAAIRSGWYRACVMAHADTVDVEFELRKESDYGMHPDGAHVLSSDDHRRLREEAAAAEAGASGASSSARHGGRRNTEQLKWQEQMVQEEDFAQTKAKMKELRGHLADIQSLMAKERRRVKTHNAINEHSHLRMVKASFLETTLFVAITLFQVYLIHSWFSTKNPVLGR